jgi:acyl-CoA thioesterase
MEIDMEQIKEFFKRDKFAEYCGIEIVDVTPGSCTAKMKITHDHRMGFGYVHGGAIFTLADLAFAVACNSHGTCSVAINVNITYMKSAKDGYLTAEAKEVTQNPKLGSYRVDVKDEQGDIIAVFEGLAYKKNVKIDEI